jgi:threonine synthase
LYEDARLAAYVGVASLFLKHEGENPTGSFKDRGMTVGISHAKWLGATTVACASSGNTSSALAGYAARAGLRALTFVPQGKVSLGKLSQTVAYGAKTVQIEGSFDAALDLVRAVSKERGVYLVNSINPYRLEGQKTIIFEALQQLEWHMPDWIVVPGGNLGNTSAFGKALYELRELGLIGPKLPRIATIQAAGSAPFYDYFRHDFQNFKAVHPETVATAIRIGNPINFPKAQRALEWTNGIVESVTDSEIMEAKAHLDRSGIGGEPAAGATLAGIRKLTANGTIKAGDVVVGILTGHILKDSDSIINYHFESDAPDASKPIKVRAELAEVLALLDQA